MRIIDKNKDYYDFVQFEHYDDAFTFDRSKSYVMTKQDILDRLRMKTYRFDVNKRYLLLQICHTFWVFELNVNFNNMGMAEDYIIESVQTWSNYNSNRELMKLSTIDFPWRSKASDFINLVDRKDYKEYYIYDKFYIYKGNEKEERNLPILREIGIASFVDAHDIYNALEMYFSEEKTASERTEPLGMTNEDKIISHGFDIKSSFRS